jgi:50S ribosomal protein L16 3-hydroxylase
MTTLGDLSPQQFLADYWQKKPLLIRNAYAVENLDFTPDDLAGLAGEEFIESRLITVDKRDQWQLRQGPFYKDDFNPPSDVDWTLLVQAVDHWVPEIRQLLAQFNFIPSWRIDDIMISYAPTGGGVGPHFDQYDVFLLQLTGQRHWKVGQYCDENSALKPDLPVKILQQMDVTEEWLLNPGDMLYLPPGVAHDGISASDDCMTCSIGFRAPSKATILSEYFGWLSGRMPGSERYGDADLQLQNNPAEITDSAIERIQDVLKAAIEDKTSIAQWFGQYMTEPKYPEQLEQDEDLPFQAIQDQLKQSMIVIRNESSRFAFDQNHLYVDGESYSYDSVQRPFIETLCNEFEFASETLQDYLNNTANNDLFMKLLNSGALYFEDISE